MQHVIPAQKKMQATEVAYERDKISDSTDTNKKKIIRTDQNQIKEFSKVEGYNINTQKSAVFLYTVKELSEEN